MKNIITSIIFIILSFFTYAQQSLVRFPSVDPSGKNIAFSYQGDIWLLNTEENIPKRLTIHEAYDSSPIWSPDGKMIAFSSNRFGSTDIFVMNIDGSGIKRLTFHPSANIINSWNIQDRIIFESRHISAQIARENEIYYISPKGGNPHKFMEALGSEAVESPDGKQVAFVRGSCRITRQAYQGSANRDIWLYNKEDKTYTQLTTDDYNQFMPQWENNNKILFISSNGTDKYQLMNMSINDLEVTIQNKTITNFKEFGLRYFRHSIKSNTTVLESGNQIFMKTLGGNKLTPLSININIENRNNTVEHKTYTGNVNDFSLSPNGKYLASSIHGNIYITQAKDKDNFTRSLTNDNFLNEEPQWLNDTTILFTSNREGNKDIFVLKSSDDKKRDIFKSLKHIISNISNSKEDERNIVVSNQKNKISYVINYGELIVANINKTGKLSQKVSLLDSWAEPSRICWSPDDKYLAYSKTDLDFNNEVYIQPVDNSFDPVNVSMHPRSDHSPSWSPDGKKLIFSSLRNNGDYDLWYVWLQKKDWAKTSDEWKLDDDEEKKDKKDKKNDSDKDEKKNQKNIVEVKIDFENIYQRLYQLTSLAGNETRPIFSKDGKTIFFNSNNNIKGKTNLYKIQWNKKDIKELSSNGKPGYSMKLSRDGKYVYMVQKGGKISRLKISNDKIENIAITAKTDIDHKAIRKQVFEQGWKVINDGFYDPNFHGKDWKKLGAAYKPIALNASTTKDFDDIFNWMLGEINASHMGLYGPSSKPKTNEKTGLLGIDFTAEKDGLHITKVLKDSPANKEESKLMVGDIITTVNDIKITKEVNFYEELTNQVNELIILQIERNGNAKEIIIRPISSLNSLKYNDWVSFNRQLVDEYSNGDLGYLHIKAMGWTSFERFERDLMAAGHGKKGILIDVRYNGGGWTTDYLMAVLTVKQHAYTIPRGASDDLEKDKREFRDHYAFGERLPFAAWTKPSIAICNQNSYSNAEIFSHAYKSNKLGTLVGTPTFGAVISTSSRTLIDGSYIRLPFRGWYVKSDDKNMDFHAAVPDVIIDILPDSRSKGKDEQLQKAVEILLEQLP